VVSRTSEVLLWEHSGHQVGVESTVPANESELSAAIGTIGVLSLTQLARNQAREGLPAGVPKAPREGAGVDFRAPAGTTGGVHASRS
jgi:hypothetical protein